jgi:hypothetical protein
MAAKKKSSKKAATKKSPGKKATSNRAASKKASSKKATSKKAPAALRVLKATPSRDGSMWTLSISNGAKPKVSAAAAQSAGVCVGGAWSDALAARVKAAAEDQSVFLRAMQVLAKKGRTTAPALTKLLGGDARAKRTVATLKKNGWIG